MVTTAALPEMEELAKDGGAQRCSDVLVPDLLREDRSESLRFIPTFFWVHAKIIPEKQKRAAIGPMSD